MARKRRKSGSQTGKSRGHLLLVSYFFPPTAGGGVFRPLAMVKYLSRLGWRVTVLTATTPRHYPIDPALERQIPADVEVIRIPVVWEGSLVRRALGKLGLDWLPKHLLTPDERVFWAERVSSRARKLLREDSFDCIYTTGPPFSVLMCGLWIRRQVETPWVAEFRDPWTLAPYLSIPNAHHRRFANDAEDDLMRTADAVVMVTPTFARMMREKYAASAERVHCVPNGFDWEEFDPLSGERPGNESCTVVAAGTVFGRYNMDDFVGGLEKLKRSAPDVYSNLEVIFQGLPDYRLNRRLLESGLNDRCESRGFVAHARNIRDLCAADLLVLSLAPVPNSEGHVPSRVYEYLASGTPILAICPAGDLRQLLQGFAQVTLAEPGNLDGIVKGLQDAVSRWRERIAPPEHDRQALSKLTRKARAREMDSIIQGILEKGRKPA